MRRVGHNMVEKNNINKSVVKGAIWSTIDKFGTVVMQFVINMVLARLLAPDDFGLVGMILIIVAVSNVLTDGGFSAALIQKNDADECDFSTAFYVNIATAALLYMLIYVAAPLVSLYLEIPLLKEILRFIGIVVIINSLGFVPKVKLRRLFAFKQIALSNIIAYIISAAVAILMSYNGYGPWSLVVMYIVNSLFSNLFMCFAVRWIPSLTFSYTSLKRMFSYGEYMLISDIMSNVCFHIQSTLVGKYFTPYTAGQYAQAKKMEEVACITLPSALNQVLFPFYSRLQNDILQMRSMLRQHTQMIAFLIFPLLTILIIIAEPLILFLFGPKWVDSIIYFQMLCIGGFFCSLQYFNYQAVAAIGKSRVLFYAGIVKSCFLIVSIMISVRINMESVLIAMILSNIVNYLVNAIIAQIYIKYSVWQQIVDVLQILVLSIIVGVITYCLYDKLNVNWIVTVAIFLAMYVAANYFVKNEMMANIIKLIIKIKDR